MAPKGRFTRYRERKKLPANHQWMPISAWKIARVLPRPAPTPRALSCRFALRDKASTFHLLSVQPQYDAEARWAMRQQRKLKLAAKSMERGESDQSKTHHASLLLLEGLQFRFLKLFLELKPKDQQALIENFLIHNFSIWQFGPEEQLSPEDADITPLAETSHDAFQSLMQRLTRLISNSQSNAVSRLNRANTPEDLDDAYDDVFDNVFGDQDPLDSPEQQQIMRNFLEASISAILLLTQNKP